MNDQTRILISLARRELERAMEQKRRLSYSDQISERELFSGGLRSRDAAVEALTEKIREYQNRLTELMNEFGEDE